MVHSKVSFIIYSAISMPPYFLLCFLVTFQRLTKTFQFLKMICGRNSRSYFNLFLIYAVTRDGLKCKPSEIKNSFDSSKDRVDTKILIQDKKTFLIT